MEGCYCPAFRLTATSIIHHKRAHPCLRPPTRQPIQTKECAVDVVAGALEGYNGTILCYGQTGAGKTFTMTGDRSSYQQRGLIPRTIAALMAALRAEQGLASWRLRVSYLEVCCCRVWSVVGWGGSGFVCDVYCLIMVTRALVKR